MFGWFNKAEREIRQLNRDAPVVIEAARESYRTELVQAIALLTHERLEEAKQNCDGESACFERAVAHFKTLHRESRAKQDHVGLTAYTLVIIYLRSLAFDEACDPARTAIDAFLDEWRHTFEGEEGVIAP